MRSLCLVLPILLSLPLAACSSEQVDRSYFVRTSDKHHLHVTEQGPADSETIVVVLHGGPHGEAHSYNTGMWASELEDRVRMVYLDQRGQGASQGPLDLEGYTPQRAADDVDEVVAFLEARDPDARIYLFGHSWGGMLGVLALLDTDLGDRVHGWVEAAGCHDAKQGLVAARSELLEVGSAEVRAGRNAEEWRGILDFAEPFDPEASNDYLDLVELNHLGHRAESLIGDVRFDTGEGMWSMLQDVAARPSRGSVAYWSGMWAIQQLKYDIEQLNLASRMHEIHVPSLFLYGRYDFVCPHPLGEDAVQRVDSDSRRYVEFSSSGHSLMFNEPEPYTEAIVDFLERTDGL